MNVECVDLETRLFIPGDAAPKMICMAWSDGTHERLLVPWEGEDPYDFFEAALKRHDTIIINQSIFFDLGVLCAERPHLISLVFARLESGHIRCVKVREQLIRIAVGEAKFVEAHDDGDDEDEDDEDTEEGNDVATKAVAKVFGQRIKTRFDLAATAKRWLGITLLKEGTWRKSYALLENVALKRWPPEAIEYPLKDARTPLNIWHRQEAWIKNSFPNGVLPGEIEANCAAWALHLMKIWGVRTCAEAVAKLTEELQRKVLWTTIGLMMLGVMRLGGTKAKPKAVSTKAEVQRRVTLAYTRRGLKVPFTDPTKKFPYGQVKTGKKVLEEFKAKPAGEKNLNDESLELLAEHNGYTKILSTYIPKYVARGVHVPINADWNVLVESFRISCANPNLTNPPRAGDVRRCFKARRTTPYGNTLYVSADYDQAELRSWAEVCQKMFGYSTMAEAFRNGVDPHLKLGAELLGISLEEAIVRYAAGDKIVEERRQFSKEPNFGLIGGMGGKKFAERAALKGIFLGPTEELAILAAKKIIVTWKNTWPEAKEYLAYFERNYSTPGMIIHPITGMIRGGCGYADGANHLFQHLTAIGAKLALWNLSKESYLDEKSPIYGARPILDMHDELFGEIPEWRAHEGAMRWGAVMQSSMETYIKSVPVKCTPVLTRRLYKGAKPVIVNGELVPSKPVYIDGKTKWVHDTGEEEQDMSMIDMRMAA